jgi:hypothetical protein
MLPSCRHTSLLRRLRSWAMRPPRASSGGKMARLKRTTYSSPTPKRLIRSVILFLIDFERQKMSENLFNYGRERCVG